MHKVGSKPLGPPSAPPTAADIDRAVGAFAAKVGNAIAAEAMRAALEGYLAHVDVAPEDVGDVAADLYLKFAIRSPANMAAALANMCL